MSNPAEEMSMAAKRIREAKRTARKGSRIQRTLQNAEQHAMESSEKFALGLDGCREMYTARRQVISAMTMTSVYEQVERLAEASAYMTAAYVAHQTRRSIVST